MAISRDFGNLITFSLYLHLRKKVSPFRKVKPLKRQHREMFVEIAVCHVL
jgi:hypothetical protein